MISSTALDLPEHRKQAIDACLSTGFRPIGMEHLPARDASGVAASLEMVAEADSLALRQRHPILAAPTTNWACHARPSSFTIRRW